MSPAPRASSGGSDIKVLKQPKTDRESKPRHSAADVRRTIIVFFGGEGRYTPDQVEQAIAEKLPDAHALISSQLRVLLDGDYLGPVEKDSRQLTLTEAGRRWLSGIRALSGGSSGS